MKREAREGRRSFDLDPSSPFEVVPLSLASADQRATSFHLQRGPKMQIQLGPKMLKHRARSWNVSSGSRDHFRFSWNLARGSDRDVRSRPNLARGSSGAAPLFPINTTGNHRVCLKRHPGETMRIDALTIQKQP
jgi:hypothetical protein